MPRDLSFGEELSNDQLVLRVQPVVMGPGFRRDDIFQGFLSKQIER